MKFHWNMRSYKLSVIFELNLTYHNNLILVCKKKTKKSLASSLYCFRVHELWSSIISIYVRRQKKTYKTIALGFGTLTEMEDLHIEIEEEPHSAWTPIKKQNRKRSIDPNNKNAKRLYWETVWETELHC